MRVCVYVCVQQPEVHMLPQPRPPTNPTAAHVTPTKPPTTTTTPTPNPRNLTLGLCMFMKQYGLCLCVEQKPRNLTLGCMCEKQLQSTLFDGARGTGAIRALYPWTCQTLRRARYAGEHAHARTRTRTLIKGPACVDDLMQGPACVDAGTCMCG
jgi:hypothetical protein